MKNMRERILKLAIELYLQSGLRGISMRKIASRLGVSATAIYRHYENIQDLICRLIDEGFRIFGSYLFRALEGKTPQDRLMLSGKNYLDFALENPKYYELIFMSAEQIGFLKTYYSAETDISPTFQFLVDRVQECLKEGFLRNDDPIETAFYFWSVCHGLVSLYLFGWTKAQISMEEFKGIYERSLSRLIKGLSI